MADEDIQMAQDGSSTSTDESDHEPPTESLVAGRKKRETAGNRMSTLIQKEVLENDAEDEVDAIFAGMEVEGDVEFDEADSEGASDFDLESSSDDDDQGPGAGADDLEGEKEIEKQAKDERKKKRKAHELLRRPKFPRVKVKVDPTIIPSGSTTPAPRPKKKSERTSWLPTTDEGPVRASSRKQTVKNKEVVHKKMQEAEKKRRAQLKSMEAAAKRKEAEKPKAMTQADRMAEAAKVEMHNAKSLNRWETAERKRQEEQKAKLAALKNRQLKGPVVTWWSGPSKWVDGKLVAVGSGKKVVEIKDYTEPAPPTKRKYVHQKRHKPGGNPPLAATTSNADVDMADAPASAPESTPVPTAGQTPAASTPQLAAEPMLTVPQIAFHPPMVLPAQNTPPLPQTIAFTPGHAQETPMASVVKNGDDQRMLTLANRPAEALPLLQPSQQPQVLLPAPLPPPPPPVIQFMTRNLVSLSNVEGENSKEAKELQELFSLGRKSGKLSSKFTHSASSPIYTHTF